MNKEETLLCARYYNLVFPDETHKGFQLLYESPYQRTEIHDTMAEVFDVDRKMISDLTENIYRKYGCDSTSFSFNHDNAFRDFVDGIEHLRSLPREKRRTVIPDKIMVDEIPCFRATQGGR